MHRIEGTEQPYWVSIDQRRKLLRAALREDPDAMIAVGDHIYWDLRYGHGTGRLPIGKQFWARQIMGSDFERDVPVLGTANEARLKRAADRMPRLFPTPLRRGHAAVLRNRQRVTSFMCHRCQSRGAPASGASGTRTCWTIRVVRV